MFEKFIWKLVEWKRKKTIELLSVSIPLGMSADKGMQFQNNGRIWTFDIALDNQNFAMIQFQVNILQCAHIFVVIFYNSSI